MGLGDCPLPDDGRGHPGRHGAQRLRLRPVHRRPRRPLRHRGPRRHGHPGVRRQLQAPGDHHARLRLHRAHVHPLLRPQPGRRHERCRHQPGRSQAAGGHPRGRTVEREHARGGRAQARHQGAGHLRPVRGHRPGREHGMPPLQARHARSRGQLPARGDRPGDPGTAALRRDRRVGVHHPDQGGLPAHPLPHQGHLPAVPRALRLRPHPGAHGQGHRPHRRHAHHPRCERLPVAGGARAHGHRRGRAPLPDRGQP